MSEVAGRCLLLMVLSILVAVTGAHGRLSGRLDLDMIARRIPTTLTGEIKLDTPSEFTMLEFAIASRLNLTMDYGLIDPSVKVAINTAGIEHFIFSSPIAFGDLSIYEIWLDEFNLAPEVWVAVPFEAVTDVNNLPNSVVIPPGNSMFVKARVTLEASVAGFRIEHLMMLEDVNFPNPGASYDPLYYELSDQLFAMGSLTSASWRASVGLSMSAQIGLSAARSSNSVKGHSATGKVTPDSSFARLGVGGISLGDISLFNVGLQSVTLGTSFSVATGVDETFAMTLSLSGEAWSGTNISGSITLSPFPPALNGLTLTVTEEPFKLSIALDRFDITGLSASCGNSLNLGPISGSWSLSATGIERGLTGLALRLSLAQGVFSTNTSITFSQRGEDFGFASWGTTLSFRFSPAVVSVQATFGRYGLTRAAVTTSVSF